MVLKTKLSALCLHTEAEREAGFSLVSGERSMRDHFHVEKLQLKLDLASLCCAGCFIGLPKTFPSLPLHCVRPKVFDEVVGFAVLCRFYSLVS